MQRMAAVVVDTMCKLVNNPADMAFFAKDLIEELTKNAEEIAVPEIREKTAEALNTVKVAVGEFEAVKVACDAPDVEAVLCEILTGNAYNSDAVSLWVAQVTAPLFATARPRTKEMVIPYLLGVVSEAEAIINGEKFLEVASEKFGAGVEEEVEEDHDDLAVLCDCEFSLAYGNRVLLHNTRLKLKRGKCYGLIGPNGAGKSTLMRSIAADLVEGFPKEIRSVYVECDVSPTAAELSCVDFVHEDPLLVSKPKQEIADMMSSVGFKDDLMWGPVGALSGGWRMRLALSRAMLKEPELLLLDEPTNHVDVHGVAWLTKYVQELSGKKISSMIVSHDTVFLDNVAQDCVHYEKNRKLKVYKGNLSEFVKLVPEAAAYYKLESDNVAFSFPDPGMLEGVTSKTKALIKLTDVSFKYPTREVNTLNNISVQVSMASRVAVIGVNGAGKSTMIKLLIGELEPNEGEGKGQDRQAPEHAPRVRRAARLPPHRAPPRRDAGQLPRVALRGRHGPRGPGQELPRAHRGGVAAHQPEARPDREAASRAARARRATSTRCAGSAARTRSRSTRGWPRTSCARSSGPTWPTRSAPSTTAAPRSRS